VQVFLIYFFVKHLSLPKEQPLSAYPPIGRMARTAKFGYPDKYPDKYLQRKPVRTVDHRPAERAGVWHLPWKPWSDSLTNNSR